MTADQSTTAIVRRHDVSIDSQFIEDNDCTVRCSCGWEMSGVPDSEATRVAVSHQQRAEKERRSEATDG